MRLLFGLLVVLSLGFFAYMQWGGLLTGAAKNGQAMSDLNADKIKLLDIPVAKQIIDSAVPSGQQMLAASVPAATPVPTAAPAPIAKITPVAASAPLVTSPSAPIAVSAPAAIVAPTPVTAPVTKAATSKCMEWGEFSGTDLKRATQELANMKLGSRLSQRIVEYNSGYWVYIPPLRNRVAVNNKISQLKTLGVDEYFVVQAPRKWANAISLGVFKTREAANKFLSSIKKKGVRTAKIGERKSKLRFIVFVIKQVDLDTAAHLAKLQKEFANSELNAVLCK